MFFEIISIVFIIIICLLFYITSFSNKKEQIDLERKHVVITGGSLGIGRDITIEAFKQGAHVSIIARNEVNFDPLLLLF